MVIKQSRWERHCTHIDGGRDHAVVLFYATGDGAEWGYFYIKTRVYIAKNICSVSTANKGEMKGKSTDLGV